MNLLRKSRARFSRRAALQLAARRAQSARDAAQYRLGEAHRDAVYTRLVGPEREVGVVSIGERPEHDTILVRPPRPIDPLEDDYFGYRDFRTHSVTVLTFCAKEQRLQVSGGGAIRWWTWRLDGESRHPA